MPKTALHMEKKYLCEIGEIIALKAPGGVQRVTEVFQGAE